MVAIAGEGEEAKRDCRRDVDSVLPVHSEGAAGDRRIPLLTTLISWTVLLLWPMNGQVAQPTYKKKSKKKWAAKKILIDTTYSRRETDSWLLSFRLLTKR